MAICDDDKRFLKYLAGEVECWAMEGGHSINKLTILITHRLGAARMADEILVLDQKRIVEQGTHKTLMQLKNGLYREMFESQRCWYEA